MTLFIHKPHGDKRPIQISESEPTYCPPMPAREAFTNRETTVPAMLRVSRGEGLGSEFYGFRHQRCDRVRRVERGDDLTAIAEAKAELENALGFVAECREDLQAAIRSAWGVAKSVTVKQARDATPARE